MWYVTRYMFPSHFHNIFMGEDSLAAIQQHKGPLVILVNHPTWWDPLICLHIAHALLPHRKHFAAIDKKMLDRYKVFKQLGFFGVESHSFSGARNFLEVGDQLLSQNDATIWITPQGVMTDNRAEIKFLPGVSTFLNHQQNISCVTLGIEYAYWFESTQEVLTQFGSLHSISPKVSIEELEKDMQSILLKLQNASLQRNFLNSISIFRGKSGVLSGNSILGRFLRKFLSKKSYGADHISLPNNNIQPQDSGAL